MEKKQAIETEAIQAILKIYGFDEPFRDMKIYINKSGNKWFKLIFSVLLESGKRLVIKLLNEDNDPPAERQKIEKQSEFSECMRKNGIQTPKRYTADGQYCTEYIHNTIPCCVTVEDFCGEEITEITTDTAYEIGKLLARIHLLSLENHCEIGCKTLFSAAHENDVDVFPKFCDICQNEHLDRETFEKIKTLHDEKLTAIRAIWDTLPTAAVQGDISINNLCHGENGIIVFDYNNAGDVVLISDLVLEGLLTAYEMELPSGFDDSYREHLFPAFLEGYLSLRPLSPEEAQTAWTVYTLYHALWFTKIVYNENSLQKLAEKKDYTSANRLLAQMFTELTEKDDGRFLKIKNETS